MGMVDGDRLYKQANKALVDANGDFRKMSLIHKAIWLKRKRGDKCELCGRPLSDEHLTTILHHINYRNGFEKENDFLILCEPDENGLRCHFGGHRMETRLKKLDEWKLNFFERIIHSYAESGTALCGTGTINMSQESVLAYYKPSNSDDRKSIEKYLKSYIKKALNNGFLVSGDYHPVGCYGVNYGTMQKHEAMIDKLQDENKELMAENERLAEKNRELTEDIVKQARFCVSINEQSQNKQKNVVNTPTTSYKGARFNPVPEPMVEEPVAPPPAPMVEVAPPPVQKQKALIQGEKAECDFCIERFAKKSDKIYMGMSSIDYYKLLKNASHIATKTFVKEFGISKDDVTFEINGIIGKTYKVKGNKAGATIREEIENFIVNEAFYIFRGWAKHINLAEQTDQFWVDYFTDFFKYCKQAAVGRTNPPDGPLLYKYFSRTMADHWNAIRNVFEGINGDKIDKNKQVACFSSF
jgi:hypothetical protein